MTDEEYLQALLKSALWQRVPMPSVDVALLGKMLALAREHTIVALVAHPFIEGQAKLNVEKESAAQRQALVVGMMQAEHAHKMMYAKFAHLLGELAALFGRHAIRYVVFKGYAVASHYRQPYLRTMGDVDFYVVPEDFGLAQSLIEQEWGVCVERNDLDKHDSFSYQGVRFEMHRRIETFGRMKAQQAFDAWIENVVSHSDNVIAIGDERLAVLPPLADVAVVFKHMFNHLLVEGVGLRQVADLAVLLDDYKDDVDKHALRTRLQALGYLKAFDAVVAMLHKYLDLTCAEAYAPLTDRDYCYADRIYRMVMESGNFGRKAYVHHETGKMKSMETACRAFRHCLFALRLMPSEISAFVGRRIGITMKKHFK